MANIPALIELREALVMGKKKHAQETYAKIKIKGKLMPKGVHRMEIDCATSACAAGHACLLAGDIFIITPFDVEYDEKDKPYYHPSDVRTSDGEETGLENRAAELLGLSWDERTKLFYAYNNHEETIELLDRLIAGENILVSNGQGN